MKELTQTPSCEFANELISFVYDELSPSETQAFKVHLNTCNHCAADLDSLAEMRTAIGDWRYESLAGLSLSQEAVSDRVRTKSSIAALREFFDLSPLWLKGAVGFATVLLCVLVLFSAFRLQRPPAIAESGKPGKTYDEHQVKAIVAQALADQSAKAATTTVKTETERVIQPNKTRHNTPSSQLARSRRPLSRSEREQLAADLRLSARHDDGVVLISDRINEQ